MKFSFARLHHCKAIVQVLALFLFPLILVPALKYLEQSIAFSRLLMASLLGLSVLFAAYKLFASTAYGQAKLASMRIFFPYSRVILSLYFAQCWVIVVSFILGAYSQPDTEPLSLSLIAGGPHAHVRGAPGLSSVLGKLIDITSSSYIDLPLEEKVKLHEGLAQDGRISVIFPALNETKYGQRTLESMVNFTQPGNIREMIIIDDGSIPFLNTTYNSTLFKYPFVKYVRHEVRKGLIKARLLGADIASAPCLLFLDFHVKPFPQWTAPMLAELDTHPRRVVVPEIQILDEDWEVTSTAVGRKMYFKWDMSFLWYDSPGNEVLLMSGGLFGIQRDWWYESGALDPRMDQWGCENIEQSIRLWLCGGDIVVVPEMKFAHLFRPSFPYSLNHTKPVGNCVRVVELWLDDYKEYYYKFKASAVKYRPAYRIPHIGEEGTLPPELETIYPFEGLSARFELRQKLGCKPFQTFVDKFRDVFESQNLLPKQNTFNQTLH